MIIRNFNLGIVGHAVDKFTPLTESIAKDKIRESILQYKPTVIISGGCHLGGVDIWTEEIASKLSIPMTVHKPERLSWNGGYKERNLLIARDSHLTLVIVVKEYPNDYSGMRFKGCYHCQGRNPPHVKSGGCWTAWKSKRREWIII